MKPYYEDNLVKLYNGNASDVLASFPANSVDLVVTSPPYDNLRDYDGYVFDFPAIADGLFRVLADRGVIVWVVGDATEAGTESGSSFKQVLHFKEHGFNLHDTMIYEKSNFANPSHNRYHQIFEFMFILSKGVPKTFNPIKDKVNKYREAWGKNTFRDKDGKLKERKRNHYPEMGMRTNIWRYVTGNVNGDDKMALEHPAIFPERLAQDHILSWSNPGDTVLDPMAGSGTVLKKARENNRRAIGIEISEKYCALQARRLAQEVMPL